VSRARGFGVVELLVGALLGLLALAALTAAVATAGRLLVMAGARGEAEDTVELALEAFTFDARRAGHDPAAAGVTGLALAQGDRVTFDADLDGDGVVDTGTEEHVAYLCNLGTARLSRVLGRQSMPLAEAVSTCRFRYLDGSGEPIAPSGRALTAAERLAVRSLAIDVVLRSPGLAAPAARSVTIALRTPA
jgi:Tfp pilus assembly protein PilW